MTQTADLVRSIQGEKTVVAQLFLKQHVDEHLALALTEEEWSNLADWFDKSGFAGEVEELFYSYLNRAVTEQS